MKTTPKQKKWNKATKAQRRVMVAKDVLEHIKKGNIRPVNGNYFTLCVDEARPHTSMESLQDLILNESEGPCEACAIGALFYAKVSEHNACTLGDIDASSQWIQKRISPFNSGGIINNMSQAFTMRQLRVIEMAFEGLPEHENKWNPSEKEKESALKMHRRYRSSKGLMRAIMENIIKNKGDFKL